MEEKNSCAECPHHSCISDSKQDAQGAEQVWKDQLPATPADADAQRRAVRDRRAQ